MKLLPGVQQIRLLIGLLIWGGAILWLLNSAAARSGGLQRVGGLCRDLSAWLTGNEITLPAKSELPLILAPGDPVFRRQPDGKLLQIGQVLGNGTQGLLPVWTTACSLRLDATAGQELLRQGVQLEYHQTPGSLQWVGETLLSPQIRERIGAILAEEWQKNGPAVEQQLEPLMRESVGLVLRSVETELPAVMENHRARFSELSELYQGEVIRRRLVPLVREEILPIVEEEVRPEAMELARELWDRVSLWSFTWRYLYDLSPLPERHAVRQEFERFLAREIRPALEARTENVVVVMERILQRVSRNQRIREEIRREIQTAVNDDRLQQIVLSVLRQSIVQNQTLQTELRSYFTRADVQSELSLVARRIEPMMRRIGDEVFGNREAGVTAEFARVMRVQILLKDRRWLVLSASGGNSASVSSAQDPDVLNIVRAAAQEQFPLSLMPAADSPLLPTAVP